MKPNTGRRWFVEMNGRAQGPFDQSQVQDLARLKKITPMTKIFAEGDVRWRLMNEFDEFKIASEPVSPQVLREWVVLKRKTLKEAELSQNKFDQIGPFTVDEVVEQLKTGDLSYNDYTWKKGFQRWVKLEALPEFNATLPAALPKIPDAPPAIAFVNEPKLDLSQNEQDQLDQFTVTNTQPLAKKPTKKVAAEEILTLDKPTGGKTKSVRAVEEQIVQKANGEEDDEVSEISEIAKDIQLKPGVSTSRKLVRVALASTAAALLTVSAYNFVKEKNSNSAGQMHEPTQAPVANITPPQPPPANVEPIAPALNPNPVIENHPAPQAQVQNTMAPQTAPQAKSASGKPSQLPQKQYSKADYEMPKNPKLEIELVKPESLGQIVFSTNAPVNYPVEVKITAKSGQILKYASYSQTLKVQRQGGEVPSIQLSALKVPNGTYTVQAKFNDLTKQKTFFYGVKDSKFQKALEANLKKISTEQIAEKKMVFYYLRDLERKTKDLDSQKPKQGQSIAQWSKAYATWRKDVLKSGAKAFSALRKMNLHDIAYPDLITRAKELSQNLLKQGEELNAAAVQNRYLSSSGVGPILNQIRDLKKEVANLSRY